MNENQDHFDVLRKIQKNPIQLKENWQWSSDLV